MTTIHATTPYAWPFDGRVRATSTALVVTGADARTASLTPDDVEAAANLVLLRDLAAVGVLVVLVAHELEAVAGSHGAVEAPAAAAVPLTARPGELVVVAAGLDGFYGSRLDATLRRAGRSHVLLAGIGLETTVHGTLRRANDRGYECLVVADACLCGDPALRAASISSIEMSGGIFGAVGTTTHVLAAYSGPAAQELT